MKCPRCQQREPAAATTYREMDIVSGLSRKTEQDQTEVEG